MTAHYLESNGITVIWNTFQLSSLAIGATMVALRIIVLRRKTGVNPVKINHPSEVGFVLGEVVIVLLLLRATQVFVFPLPAWMDTQIVDSGFARILGAILAVAGLVIFGSALVSFGDSWRIGIDRKTPSSLVTGGLFRFTRNPIFVFLDLFLAGIFLINGTVVFMIAVILSVLFLHFQIRREEQFLRKHYGEAYRLYCERTPRYFFR